MKPITKRLAQMATIYAAKKIWDRVDANAVQSLARDLYRSTPKQWQENASRLARSSVNGLQGKATARFDDVIHQAGLIRLADVPSRRGPMLLALVGGTVVGAAGTLVLLRTDTGKSFIKKMNAKASSDEDEASVDGSLGMEPTQTIARSDSTIRKSNESTSKSNESTSSPLHQAR